VQQSYIYKILGLVCFSKDALKLFHQKNQSIIERYESIEQIRLLELNLNVQGVLLNQPYPSINEPSDEEEVLSFLMRSDNLRDLNRVLNFDK
jgi:CMP-2-keto-3-deoxyoctulosonic acid synthetase